MDREVVFGQVDDDVHMVVWEEGIATMPCGMIWFNVTLANLTWDETLVTCQECKTQLSKEEDQDESSRNDG